MAFFSPHPLALLFCSIQLCQQSQLEHERRFTDVISECAVDFLFRLLLESIESLPGPAVKSNKLHVGGHVGNCRSHVRSDGGGRPELYGLSDHIGPRTLKKYVTILTEPVAAEESGIPSRDCRLPVGGMTQRVTTPLKTTLNLVLRKGRSKKKENPGRPSYDGRIECRWAPCVAMPAG